MKNTKSISKKNTWKHVFTTMLALVMALSLSCSVFSTDTYAASSKSQVNSTVNKLMKGIKKCNQKNINACLLPKDSIDFSVLKSTMPGFYNYVKKANNKISYQIKKTTVKGSTATVKVRVKYVNGTEFAENCIRSMARAVKAGDIDMSTFTNYQNMTESDVLKLMKTYDKIYADASAKCSLKKMRTQTITLKLKKTGKKWKLSVLGDDLSNIIMADIARAASSISEDRIYQIMAEEI